MIINKQDPRFSDVPASLDGEVLLERVRDGSGRLVGFITAPVSVVMALKTKTDAELTASGWIKYKKVISSL